jgi:helicase MOV-10
VSFLWISGKTSTVTETILRICRDFPNHRVLACAPSDAAADVLCERLSRHLTRSQLFRLNWWQRLSASVPAKLRPYTLDVNDIFEMPPVDVLGVYQVIVCNCGTAGALKTPRVTPMLFDVVIVDEASQAMEAEVRMCVVCVLSFILACSHRMIPFACKTETAELFVGVCIA